MLSLAPAIPNIAPQIEQGSFSSAVFIEKNFLQVLRFSNFDE